LWSGGQTSSGLAVRPGVKDSLTPSISFVKPKFGKLRQVADHWQGGRPLVLKTGLPRAHLLSSPNSMMVPDSWRRPTRGGVQDHRFDVRITLGASDTPAGFSARFIPSTIRKKFPAINISPERCGYSDAFGLDKAAGTFHCPVTTP